MTAINVSDEQLLNTIAAGIEHLQRATFGSSFTKIPSVASPEDPLVERTLDMGINIENHLRDLEASETRLMAKMAQNTNDMNEAAPGKERFKLQVYHYSLHRSHERIRATIQFIQSVKLMGRILDHNKDRLDRLSGVLKEIIDDLKKQLVPTTGKHAKGRNMDELNQTIVDKVKSYHETLEADMRASAANANDPNALNDQNAQNAQNASDDDNMV